MLPWTQPPGLPTPFSSLQPPSRPNFGQVGRPIGLRANHFQVKIPTSTLYHYDVGIQPDKCPRRVNREIIEALIQTRSEYFENLRPVFDGKKNLYSRVPLPGIGRERVMLNTIINIPQIFISVGIIALNYITC
jgi:eukaryotic translation initiation factor 2C